MVFGVFIENHWIHHSLDMFQYVPIYKMSTENISLAWETLYKLCANHNGQRIEKRKGHDHFHKFTLPIAYFNSDIGPVFCGEYRKNKRMYMVVVIYFSFITIHKKMTIKKWNIWTRKNKNSLQIFYFTINLVVQIRRKFRIFNNRKDNDAYNEKTTDINKGISKMIHLLIVSLL